MRTSLQDASAARLELDLSGGGEPRLVVLTGLRGVSGELDGSSGAELRPLRVAGATLAELELPLPGRGRLSITSPAVLADLAIEADFSAQVTGAASAARVEADAIAIEVPGGPRVAVDADADRLEVVHTPERVGHAGAEKLAAANVQVAVAGAVCRLSSALLDRARVDWRAGEVLIGAAVAGASGVSVAVPGAGLTVEADRLELPGGLRTSRGAVVIPELAIPEVRVAIEDVMALFGGGGEEAAHDGGGAAGTAGPRPPFDFGFLDRLTGRLGVDVTLDISLPVLGRREGTHRFRVPISGGIINYRELERDLSNLEDAFIDVEVRGRQLVIERAIPLIPGLEKPLVVWDLDAEELELARRRLVRLRTIPRMRMAVRGADRGDRSSVAVRSLRLDAVDLDVALDPATDGAQDSIGRASAGRLRVTGRLVHEPSRTPAATELTSAALAGSELAAGPLELPAGAGRIEIEAIELGAIAGAVSFAGFRPRAATLTARDLRVRNLRLRV